MSRSTERFIWFVFGLTGTGKTYLVEQFLGAFLRPIIIPDTMGEWTDYGHIYEDPEGLLRDVGAALNGEIEWPPGGVFVLKAFEVPAVHDLFQLAHKWRVPGVYLSDEVHRYAPSGKPTAFLEMIRTGRHARQSIVGITQRPQGIHNHAVEEAAITTFELSGRAAQYLTNDPPYMPKHVDAEEITSLSPQEYMLGGRLGQLPFSTALGDADGSVWTYDAEGHQTQKVRGAATETA